MDFNKSLIKKIDNLLKLGEQFDKICLEILSSNAVFDIKTVENVRLITSIYMMIRSEHGHIIILNEQLKEKGKESIGEKIANSKSIKVANILYDISTFTSIMENINNLVSNIDFEYKKIALMYPKLINKDIPHMILFVENKKDKFIKIIDDLKTTHPEYSYHIIEHNLKNKKVDWAKILGKTEGLGKISINIEKLPSGFLTNGTTITEIPLDKINNSADMIKFLD
jgi:hypothetical protein